MLSILPRGLFLAGRINSQAVYFHWIQNIDKSKCYGSCCPDNRCTVTLLSRYSCYIMGCLVRFRQGKEFFRLHALQTECGTDTISYIWVTQTILGGIRSFSLACITAEFKNAWSSAHTPLCVFIAWFLIKAGDFFFFTYRCHRKIRWQKPLSNRSNLIGTSKSDLIYQVYTCHEAASRCLQPTSRTWR
jgi:hypothetical protein